MNSLPAVITAAKVHITTTHNTRGSLRDLIRTHRPFIVFLMEIKNKDFKLEQIRRSVGFLNKWYVSPKGISGGLALWWSDDVSVSIISSSSNIIHTKVDSMAGIPSWFASFVYVNPIDSIKRKVSNLRPNGCCHEVASK